METIPLFKVQMSEESKQLVAEVLDSGMITQASKVEQFEADLAAFFDWPYVVTVNSATSGLMLAYKLLGVHSDSKVISTPLTCFATNAAIYHNTKKIVWADTNSDTCNIDLTDVRKRLDKDVRALSVVHWGGAPADLDFICTLQDDYRKKFKTELGVVHDCAHAFGAEWNGRKLGSSGFKAGYTIDSVTGQKRHFFEKQIFVYSLQAIKHCTTGDGGVMLLPDEETYKRAKLLRWYGIDRERRSLPGADFRLEPNISEVGFKFHMNDISAAIGIGNLRQAEAHIEKCRENAKFYDHALQGIPEIQLFEGSLERKYKGNPAYWIYTLKVLNGHKNRFMAYMKEHKIVVSQVHARNDNHSCLAFAKANLPVLDEVEKQIVSIPVGPWVSEEDRERIVKAIRSFPLTLNGIRELVFPDDFESYQDLMAFAHGGDSLLAPDKVIDGIFGLWQDMKLVCAVTVVVPEKLGDAVAMIEDVVTHPEFRRQGCATELVSWVVEKIKEIKTPYKIVLACKEELAGLYEKCGFKKSGVAMTLRNH